ncbi:MAG: hypothetical protein ACJ76I_05475 [Gaiellaceae bacterium]
MAILLAAVAVLAGCGGSKHAYSLAATERCATKPPLNAKLSRKVDFVASTASQGAVRMHLAHNDVTVLFSQDTEEADNLARAYRHFRASNVGVEDILRLKNNVVMLWRVHPSDSDQQKLGNCLK